MRERQNYDKKLASDYFKNNGNVEDVLKYKEVKLFYQLVQITLISYER